MFVWFVASIALSQFGLALRFDCICFPFLSGSRHLFSYFFCLLSLGALWLSIIVAFGTFFLLSFEITSHFPNPNVCDIIAEDDVVSIGSCDFDCHAREIPHTVSGSTSRAHLFENDVVDTGLW